MAMRLSDLYSLVEQGSVKVAVGAGCEREDYTSKVVESARELSGLVDVVVVGSEGWGSVDVDFVESDCPEECLVGLLRDGEVDAVVRGTLGAEKTLGSVKKMFGFESLYRVAVLETLHPLDKVFLLAPVGIDEGETVGEKVKFGLYATQLMDRLGMSGGVAVLSGGRFEDYGRSERVDFTLNQAEKVTERLEREGVDVENHQILIEDAIKTADMIIPPDGINGNLVFRTLTFLGDGKAVGAPIMNLDKTYIDTSRASENYEDAIVLAAALAMSD
ncbi:Methyltransferase subunit MtxX, phosphotransacetylase family enzyme [Methanonatronarchaeum thermophilum]|uniref:Methyltransferase subunit MtxX, phosphotransacetylase family enzyme n=1 Tax=Methanonatronarchaeum thermophilum TaxID=1927129 RepID=A0A1Y3GG78_9EURY|nr:methanogenesis marker protein Mmp4/MtxX [Methanonatronarchaeum thermophilum]OUJ19204.1 Methyltransferase subunit MtxX, phosphotransacetylase family enzyme [Methanonatronarchaeum thermophilum]